MKKILFYFSLFLFLACPLGLRAQYSELKFEHLSKDKGLSSSDVTSLVQDRQGFMWVGTKDGLNRYDGYEIKTYRHVPDDSTSLCDNNISVLFVDHRGELWVGTENRGLSRYQRDTDSFQNFPHRLHDPQGLSYYYITSITEDASHTLWVGTLQGLNRYNRQRGGFEQHLWEINLELSPESLRYLGEKGLPAPILARLARLQNRNFKSRTAFLEALAGELSPGELKSFSALIFAYAKVEVTAESIRSLAADSIGNLWIGYEQQGLGYYKPATSRLSRYWHVAGDTLSLSNNEVMSLHLEGAQLWVGTRSGGLNRLDIASGHFFRYPYQKERSHITSILRDRKNRLWIGDGHALSRYQPQTDSFYRYEQYDHASFSLGSLSVSALYEDVQGNLWVGCYQGGVNLALLDQPFEHLSHNPATATSLSKRSVSSMLKDSQGNLWIGYYTTGIDFWDGRTKEKIHFSSRSNDPHSLGQGTVFKIFEDSRGTIWVGTYRGGLQYFDPQRRRFVSYRHDAANAHSIGGNDVRDIAEDRQGNLWIAVHGAGLNMLDTKTSLFTRHRANYADWQHSLANDWVFRVLCDSRGRIWAGSVGGLSVLQPGQAHFSSYSTLNSNLSHNTVRTIFEDQQGGIWAGTENGLNRFIEASRSFSVYTEVQGLPNNFIMGGLADAAGNLWISTNGGLSRLHLATQTFRNYSLLDGLQSNEFLPGAYARGGDDELFFGGPNGVNVLNPGRIQDNAYKPPVVLTELKLFNQPVRPGEKESPLQKVLGQTAAITLSHKQNVLSIGFVGLNYINPEKNQYAYRLEGFDKDWTYAGTKREATYTNLDPGHYTFRVKAANNDGLWNEQEARLSITVAPPYWQSGWARVLYGLLLLGGLYLYRRATLRKERRRNEQRLRELEAQKIHELDTLKLNFFTNISHEFRTPLTLISDPIERLIAEDARLAPADRSDLYRLVQRNSRHLLRLINQLLDVSEVDAGVMKLKVLRWDVVQFARTIAETFAYRAERNHILFHFSANCDAAEVFFDPDKLEKILYNLLSNAFKFTPESGKISLSVALAREKGQVLPEGWLQRAGEEAAFVRIVVEDSGIGIAEEEQAKIFDRFYQLGTSGYRKTGTGLGLTLVKQLVERHGGQIALESTPGRGSKFTIWLPVAEAHFAPEEFAQMSPAAEKIALAEAEPDLEVAPAVTSAPGREPEMGPEAPLLLLIEDSPDVRYYLHQTFKDHYRVAQASNGLEGLEKAAALMPDLIISDVKMPELSGIEVCQQLKSRESTCHIPVILLTAKATEHHQLKGLDTGADDYITKPFSTPVLKAKVRNLIALRKALKERLSQDADFEPKQLATNGLDQQFMDRLVATIQAHMADAGFSPDVLAQEMGMSRAQLYRKIKGLSGLSVSIFIRNIRLREGARLLGEREGNIAEVAYCTGFSDPAYFTKCFRELYAKTPTEFMQGV